ncbi:JmjC domain-containing histone demethylation protein 1 [Tieghemiomyces parasiticus]|uniref:JmjC domain-containing histone demethylation protein 1 n=1 Tax=Tieghemiomyces parasiticus TaxID=78921 RepID=A0A9W8DGY8_9FUNG|nr:JmjC domain-containing histone demethylation protein 1 [Tieghemiomyces parasiticus]
MAKIEPQKTRASPADPAKRKRRPRDHCPLCLPDDNDRTASVKVEPTSASPLRSTPTKRTRHHRADADTDLTPPLGSVSPGTLGGSSAVYDTWLQCNACRTWYHVHCLGLPASICSRIKKYRCPTCEPTVGPTVYFAQNLRRSSRTHAVINYADLQEGVAGDMYKYSKLLRARRFPAAPFATYPTGEFFTAEWALTSVYPTDQSGPGAPPSASSSATAVSTSPAPLPPHAQLHEPILFTSPTGLDQRMPPATLTVDDVARLVGPDREVDVIDVVNQGQLDGWNLTQWAEYFRTRTREDRILNVISLEFSDTPPLADQVRRPRVVRDLDWTNVVWPRRTPAAVQGSPDTGSVQSADGPEGSSSNSRNHPPDGLGAPAAPSKPNVTEDTSEIPKIQHYCLMSVQESYTDFHIDFGGTSVFYHLLSGEKRFYFIPPTPTNRRKYEKWLKSPDQNNVFLGDIARPCYELVIRPGNTMVIPSGWIHAVYTTADSIVIGGNFLSALDLDMQLAVYAMEERVGVSPSQRFPQFEKIQWYAAMHYLKQLTTEVGRRPKEEEEEAGAKKKKEDTPSSPSAPTVPSAATVATTSNAPPPPPPSATETVPRHVWYGLRTLAKFLRYQLNMAAPAGSKSAAIGTPSSPATSETSDSLATRFSDLPVTLERRRRARKGIPAELADPKELVQRLERAVEERLASIL